MTFVDQCNSYEVAGRRIKMTRSIIETFNFVCLQVHSVSINDQNETLIHTREQNFADAKTRYEVATSSRRFFSFEIVTRLHYCRILGPSKKLERWARGPPFAPSTLTIRRPRRRASRAKRGVSIEGIRTNYRATDDHSGATGIDFPPLSVLSIFSASHRRSRTSSSPSASHPFF